MSFGLLPAAGSKRLPQGSCLEGDNTKKQRVGRDVQVQAVPALPSCDRKVVLSFAHVMASYGRQAGRVIWPRQAHGDGSGNLKRPNPGQLRNYRFTGGEVFLKHVIGMKLITPVFCDPTENTLLVTPGTPLAGKGQTIAHAIAGSSSSNIKFLTCIDGWENLLFQKDAEGFIPFYHACQTKNFDFISLYDGNPRITRQMLDRLFFPDKDGKNIFVWATESWHSGCVKFCLSHPRCTKKIAHEVFKSIEKHFYTSSVEQNSDSLGETVRLFADYLGELPKLGVKAIVELYVYGFSRVDFCFIEFLDAQNIPNRKEALSHNSPSDRDSFPQRVSNFLGFSAVEESRVDFAEMLLDHGADPNIPSGDFADDLWSKGIRIKENDALPLLHACMVASVRDDEASLQMVQLLLEYGAEKKAILDHVSEGRFTFSLTKGAKQSIQFSEAVMGLLNA